MSYSDRPSGMPGDTVPAVQYPAAEEKQQQRTSDVQSASTSTGHDAAIHLATTAPALPPRHTEKHTSSIDEASTAQSSVVNINDGPVPLRAGLANT